MKIKREAFSDCIGKISAIAGIDQDKAFDVLQQVANEGDRLRQQGIQNPFEAASKAIADREKQGVIQTRNDVLQNALKRNTRVQELDNVSVDKSLSGSDLGKSIGKTLRSWLAYEPGANNNASIESAYHSGYRARSSLMEHQITSSGLWDLAHKEEQSFGEQVAEAWWKLNGAPSRPDLKISPEAQKLAKIYHEHSDYGRDRQNAEGAHIGDAIDYVTKTNYDSRQMSLAAGKGASQEEAFEAWYKKTLPRYANSTFDNVAIKSGETPKKFMRGIYDAGVTGVHLTNPNLSDLETDAYVPPAYEGTYNTARGVSHQRVVHWKDSKAWYDNQREFGGGMSLLHQVDRTLAVSSRNTALMEKLGTNPEGNFNSIIETMRGKLRGDAEALKEFNRHVEGDLTTISARHMLDRLTGKSNMPLNKDHADLTNLLFTGLSLGRSGGIVVPHVMSSPMTISSEMAHHGYSHLASIGNVVGSLLKGKNSEELKQIGAEAGSFVQGHQAALRSEIAPNSGVSGFASWLSTHLMKFQGFPYILDRLQNNAIKTPLMNMLGENTDKSFKSLHPAQQDIMQHYGLGSAEWDLLRSKGNNHEVGGYKYLTPKAAESIDNGAVEKLLRDRLELKDKASPELVARAVQRYKWFLGDRYNMYLNDAAERGTVTPGVREQATVFGGSRPGSWGYLMARALGQYKMWPLAAWNQIVNREIFSNLSRSQKAANFGWIVALSTAAGTLRLSVNDAVAGKPQRDYTDPATLLHAWSQGGGLGLYGEMLFGEINRSTAYDTLANAGGPLTSMAEQLLKIGARFKSDMFAAENEEKDPDFMDRTEQAFKHLLPDLAHLTISNIPFANLVYLKTALDYLVFFHIYEALSPGWWDRTNQRMERERGQPMLGYTPGGGVPWPTDLIGTK